MSETPTSVSGPGDEAYYVSSAKTHVTTLRVKKWNTSFAVEVRNYSLSDEQIKAAEKTLAQQVQGKP